MALNYKRMRQTATRSIKANGQVFEMIRGQDKVEFVGGVEISRKPEKFDIIGIVTQYKPHEVNGTSILGGDIKLVATADVEIRVDDIVIIDEKQYRVIEPNPIKPVHEVISYQLQLRR
ncbi:TPA: hypothetical protein PXO92_004396 [Yersinia enterocolitica]|nr:hypothetical protein [Yersinia enterocolitica]